MTTLLKKAIQALERPSQPEIQQVKVIRTGADIVIDSP
jgi:hypothetical protein